MNLPEKRITGFLKEHHVLTLCSVTDNNPWCFNCFYVYLEDENCFVVTSEKDTKHVQDLQTNPKVAGSVMLETKAVGKIRGTQMRGIMKQPEEALYKKAHKAYLKKFPFAVFKKTSLWIMQPDYIKMTDNRLGFGKKLIWERL